MRLRIDLGYDGTDFSGWARQPARRTVEQTLDEALQEALRLDQPVGLTVAGRTDAGVHALGQVVHVDVRAETWSAMKDRLLSRLHDLLPEDVRVTSVVAAPPDFDARFAATSRSYTYRISDEPSGVDPMRRRYTLWNPRPLSVEAMDRAAALLVGEHDFVAFCRKRDGASTIRRLLLFSWRRDADGLVVGTVIADAFCHNLVRSLVGASIRVGEGRRPVEWPSELLAETSRSSAVMVVPGHGLTLEKVSYPADDQLANRIAQARNFRG